MNCNVVHQDSNQTGVDMTKHDWLNNGFPELYIATNTELISLNIF